MIDFGDYWYGYDTVVLTSQMVHADWGSDPNAIEFTNKALNIYYRARKNVESFSEFDQKNQMIKMLEDAATEGYSLAHWGDLKTALQKLARPGADRNQWTDSKTETYTCGPEKFWAKCDVKGPYAAVEFLNAMDGNIQEFKRLIATSSQGWGLLATIAKDARRDWQAIGTTLKRVSAVHSKTAKYLWLAPEKLPGLPKIKVALDKSKPFLKYVNEAYGIADDFLRYRMLGYSTSDAAQVAALKRALSIFPVLGEFYKNALDMIPTTKNWFIALMNGYLAKIDSIPGIWYDAPPTIIPRR